MKIRIIFSLLILTILLFSMTVFVFGNDKIIVDNYMPSTPIVIDGQLYSNRDIDFYVIDSMLKIITVIIKLIIINTIPTLVAIRILFRQENLKYHEKKAVTLTLLFIPVIICAIKVFSQFGYIT